MIAGEVTATAAAAGRAACAGGADSRGKTTACTFSIKSGQTRLTIRKATAAARKATSAATTTRLLFCATALSFRGPGGARPGRSTPAISYELSPSDPENFIELPRGRRLDPSPDRVGTGEGPCGRAGGGRSRGAGIS